MLLELLRTWWLQCRSRGWLFPGRDPLLPITVRQLNRACHRAADASAAIKTKEIQTAAHLLDVRLLILYASSPSDIEARHANLHEGRDDRS